ncbi:hypothetical protein HN014_10890 [Aquimarina sp. TRL1]|uniref:hypothetical protein n=1 Tax=Aquimarina sp. (strain TRL1) TaxID=2736252 RepID=UPI00158AAED4|nr:hypothetical protein [Aquimarina sp. TRL1]QKX05399.1 hypothetical protein HN014_10890 [Aquimarina sp. TRL1]
MKKIIILFGLFSVLLSITSCETQDINDETGFDKREQKATEKDEIISPGSGSGGDEDTVD